jgi:hypothetical protein
MLEQKFGNLLFDALRETLETMAFAEVVPCSSTGASSENLSQTAPETTGWGTPGPQANESSDDSWGAPAPQPTAGEEWGGSPTNPPPNDAWGEPTGGPPPDLVAQSAAPATEEVDFDSLIESGELCWARLKVNSPDIDSIWFIASSKLAMELARTMYAGEELTTESPVLRDMIAELTNVLGGRMMLLLEDILGKFTLQVPETGTGMPDLPDSTESVVCKVLVDGSYPVLASMSFPQE